MKGSFHKQKVTDFCPMLTSAEAKPNTNKQLNIDW